MKRKVGHRVVQPQQAPARATEVDIDANDDASARIVARPDGYHWLAPDGRQEFGPFESADEAMADMLVADDAAAQGPGESLHEAEQELGIADWIDPETGAPAEGQSPPHLHDE